MVFALASFIAHNNVVDAEQYHQLARAAMSCDAILIDPTIPSMRALVGFHII